MGKMAPHSSIRSNLNPSISRVPDHIITRASDRRDLAALPIRVQQLEKALDLSKYIQQVEKLLAQPIKIPGTTLIPHPSSIQRQREKPSIFSVKGIWANEEIRKEKASKLFNFKNIKDREWLQQLLLDESDSDDEGEIAFTQRDIHAILKVHRMRRKLQKQYHNDPLNSQYTYFAAGLLSSNDPFPEHQSTILRQFTANRLGGSRLDSQQLNITQGGYVGSDDSILRGAPILGPIPDDLTHPLSIDPNSQPTTVIPLPPLSQ